MSVFFVKMTNGEEVIAEVHRHGTDIVMTDPMSLEYGDNDGKRVIFMTRYNPFLENKTIRISRTLVAYMSAVTVEVSQYYSSSVEYCREVMDKNFKKGMLSASKYTYELRSEETGETASLTLEDDDVPDGNTTFH